jgi:hypothetical protein
MDQGFLVEPMVFDLVQETPPFAELEGYLNMYVKAYHCTSSRGR